jgi:FkbM family methyltransferase
MKTVGAFHFPDTERHFTQFGDDVGSYGEADRKAALAYVKRWRRALDVGANVGIFSVAFASRFDEVVAFEPMPHTLECLVANVPANVRIEPCAIADQIGTVEMIPTLHNCGGSYLYNHDRVAMPPSKKDGSWAIQVPVRTIDSYDFDAVDLIKLDIQGAECLAVLGAKETIIRHRPVVMVEQKPVDEEDTNFKDASRLLRSWGMVAKERAKTDRVFVFKD